MPDINRTLSEKEFERVIQREFNRQRRAILEEMKKDFPIVDDMFWEDHKAAFEKAVLPTLLDIYARSIRTLQKQLRMKQDLFGRIAAAAFRWGRAHAETLVLQIFGTTQNYVSAAVADHMARPDATQSDLVKMLASIFAPSRAESIAVTEFTRAHFEGMKYAAEEIRSEGFHMVGIWNTAMDDYVCPICGPLEGQAETEPGSGQWLNPDDGLTYSPPAHIRCRCDVGYELI